MVPRVRRSVRCSKEAECSSRESLALFSSLAAPLALELVPQNVDVNRIVSSLVGDERLVLTNTRYHEPHDLPAALQLLPGARQTFREISVRGDYTEEPATADHKRLVFTAVR